MIIDNESILSVGLEFGGYGYAPTNGNKKMQSETFRALYGIDAETVSDVFDDIQTNAAGNYKIREPQLVHLLMTVYWLRLYPSEHVMQHAFGYGSRNTGRKYVRKYLAAIQALSKAKIIWPFTQFNNEIDVPDIFVGSVDGVHCRIEEPRKAPSSTWYSHKFHGPAVTYQIVMSLYENKVLSITGPYHAGVNDILVFRKDGGISGKIPDGKFLIGDKGYAGERNKISLPSTHDSYDTGHYKSRARARHETFNKRIKDFKVLEDSFRHNGADVNAILNLHAVAFESVCILVQYDLKYHPLFNL